MKSGTSFSAISCGIFPESFSGTPENIPHLPSDTKLVLTNNYFEIVISEKFYEFHSVISGNCLSFPKTKRGRREGDGKKSVTTIYDSLRHFMTISVSLSH